MRSLTGVLSILVVASAACGEQPPARDNGNGGISSAGGANNGGNAGILGSGGAASGAGGFGGNASGAGGIGAGSGGTPSSGGTDASGGSAGAGTMHWVGTWATGNQVTEPQNNPPAPGIANNTLRQIVRVSIGGSELRLRLSNEYGSAPVTMNAVHVAKAMSGASIDTTTDQGLTFAGSPSVEIPAGQTATSDPFQFTLVPLSTVAITIAFGAQSGEVTGHPGSRTTSYLQSGNQVSAASISQASTDHWYFISNIDVMADSSTRAIAILGDSITDGRGSTTNGNDRWPDVLANRLQADLAKKNIAVLNLGIGGNNLIQNGLGPPGLARFQSQIIGQAGVRWVVVLEGINDIGGGASGADITLAYQQLIDQAHAAGLLIYGIPILPFAGNTYDESDNQADRLAANDFIRAPGNFDAFLPLDEAVTDGGDPPGIHTDLDFQDDRLHLNPTGLAALANAIDLSLFTP